MALTLKEMERRLLALEAEVARLRAPTNGAAPKSQPADEAPRPPRQPGEKVSIFSDPIDVVLEDLRRRGVPTTIEELRAAQKEEERHTGSPPTFEELRAMGKKEYERQARLKKARARKRAAEKRKAMSSKDE